MAPAYKLYYFDLTGLAEPIRFLFSYGNIEFEDVRVKHENWPELKPKMPFGTIPVLEFEGKKVGQSLAIARYLAKKVKLVGDSDWENLEIDAVVDTVNDLRIKAFLHAIEKDEAKKEEMKKTVFEETLPFYLERLEKLAKKNNGYLAVGRLTWADLFFVSLFDAMESFMKIEILEKYPSLKSLKIKVLNIPSIKKWVDSRPQ